MYLFSRSTTLSSQAALDWARAIRDRASAGLGNETQLWTSAYSPDFGLVTWTSWWKDLAELESAVGRLGGDAQYLEMAAKGREFITGSIDDSLAQAITDVAIGVDSHRYVGTVQATVAAGNAVRAFGAGVEIATRFQTITGSPSMFARRLTGPYGGVAWFSAFDSLAAFEAAENKLNADAGFVTYLDSTEGCFSEGSGQTHLWVKID
jgi:hypothetical protein